MSTGEQYRPFPVELHVLKLLYLLRKIGIVSFARQTRLQLVRLLALVKWAGSSDSVQKCSVSGAPLLCVGVSLHCLSCRR